MAKQTFKLKGKVWIYPGMALLQDSGQAGWHFFTVPKKETAQIQKDFKHLQKGWGSIPVNVTIGTTTWRTSIFPDKKSGVFLLPLKKDVRKKEGIFEEDMITVLCTIA